MSISLLPTLLCHNINTNNDRVYTRQISNMDNLREHVMVNHFVSATGCHAEQAKQCLAASNWQFQVNIVKIFKMFNMAHVFTLCKPVCLIISCFGLSIYWMKRRLSVSLIYILFIFQTALSLFFQESSIPTCRTCNGNHTQNANYPVSIRPPFWWHHYPISNVYKIETKSYTLFPHLYCFLQYILK